MIDCEKLEKGDLTDYLFCKEDYKKVTEEYCQNCKALQKDKVEIEKAKANILIRIAHYFKGGKK